MIENEDVGLHVMIVRVVDIRAKSMIFLDSFDDYTFLNVEVQRFHSTQDPGPSSGRIILGRARIPSPKLFYHEVVGSFSLIKSEGNTKVHIIVAMRLERINNIPYWYPFIAHS
ncbi:hypothetical protein VNO77_08886 [Canavalia gladiata]|uniref:Uncharacterized protein n=1 Tax=Canavalia gladiata TaxID=3824 RepID=A0AAN9R170_CANGL